MDVTLLYFDGCPSWETTDQRLLIDGRDPFARGDEPVGLSCRIYQTPEGPAGSPAIEQLHEVLDVR